MLLKMTNKRMPIKMLLSNDFIVLQVIKKKKVEVFLIIARSHNY